MSAFKYLAFALGIPLVAVFGAIWMEVITPMLAATRGQAETQAADTGIMWLTAFTNQLPLVLLGLLVFALLVGIIVRRNTVGGGT